MSNRKFLCFDCRMAVRRYSRSTKPVKCPSCGKECINIGYKIPVPPKKKIKEWEKLRLQLANENIEKQQRAFISNVQKKHALEKEIAKLKSLPSNTGRASLIKQLQTQLKAIGA